MEARLATLTRKLVDGVITDEAYKVSQQEYEQELHRLRRELEHAGSPGESLQDRTERLLDFSANALYVFRQGNAQTRRLIMANLGSNLRLLDRKLLVELYPSYRVIQDMNDSKPDEKARLEPRKTGFATGRKAPCAPTFPIWRPVLEAIRTFLAVNPGVLIPILHLGNSGSDQE